MCQPAPIKPLEEHVVHRIAAGEVIQRPSSALKELIENSLDAGATRLVITVKEGGLKLLQIQDDGSGIRHEDLPILAHRHTTSKLRQFEDLETISTLGFRGEALASISFVAHMAVVTMTRSSQHGWRVEYRDSQVVPPGPKAVAAVPGTTITVEDMFYNVPARRKAFKAGQEEYNLVKELIQRYAVYCAPGVSFTLKRQGETRSELHTLASATRLDVIRSLWGAEVAGKLLPLEAQQGGSVGPEVGLDGGMRFQLRGYISNLTYVGRRTTLVLFINGRPVEHGQLKRGLEALYAAHNPKAGKPWVFFDLLLPPRHVEVNMHPTKKEVGFLHQDAVVDAICQEVEQVLLAASSTRSFTVARLPLSSQLPDNGQQAQQAALPAGAPGSRKPQQQDGADAEEDAAHAGVGQSSAAAAHSQLRRRSSSAGVGDTAGNSSGSQLVQLQLGGGRPSSGASQLPSARPERLVRMDPRMQTLDSFLVRQPAAAAAQGAAAAAPVRKRKASAAGLPAGGAMPFAEGEDAIDLTGFNSSNLHLSNQAAAAAAEAANGVDADQQQQEQQLGHSRPDGVSATPSTAATAAAAGAGTQAQGQGRLRLGPVATQLSSIRELLEEVEAERHEGLSEMLRDHVWVGMAVPTQLLLQHQTKLYLIDLTDTTRDLFYHLALHRWEAHGQLELDPPLPVADLLLAALGEEAAAGRWQAMPGVTPDQLVSQVTQLLADKAPMLSEYLSLVFDEAGQQLQALPRLLEGYVPDLGRLPQLLLGLVRDVDWNEERACFRGLCSVLADFYALGPLLPAGGACDTVADGQPQQVAVTQLPTTAAAAAGGEGLPDAPGQQPAPQQRRQEQGGQQQHPEHQQAEQQQQQGQADFSTGAQQQAAAAAGAGGHPSPPPTQPVEVAVSALEEDEQALLAAALEQGHAAGPLQLSGAAAAGGAEAEDMGQAAEVECVSGSASDPLAPHRSAAQREQLVRQVVCRALRWLHKPPQQRARDGSVLLLTSMERLYKVFERCR